MLSNCVDRLGYCSNVLLSSMVKWAAVGRAPVIRAMMAELSSIRHSIAVSCRAKGRCTWDSCTSPAYSDLPLKNAFVYWKRIEKRLLKGED